jgi:hypothetical protein
MARFDASALNALEGPVLFNQVTSIGSTQLQAYLCCGTGVGHNPPRIYCVHSPAKFVPALDGAPSAWDGWTFAFLGELVQGQVTNILLPNTAFDITTVWAQSQMNILANLAALK